MGVPLWGLVTLPAILHGVNDVLLAASILAADFAELGTAVRNAEAAGADLVHIDVMDGRFVPNLSMGPAVVSAMKRASKLPLDVHLMIVEPERYVDAFATAGAGTIIVHAEATHHLHGLLQQVRETGADVGLALNPLTPLEFAEEALPYLDQLLVMTVEPGFGGQDFIPASIRRLSTVRALRDRLQPRCRIEVDGGITADTASDVVAVGADVLVAGSAIFGGQGTVSENVAAMRASIQAGVAQRDP